MTAFGTLALLLGGMIAFGTLSAWIHDLLTGYRGPELTPTPGETRGPRPTPKGPAHE